MVHGLENDLRAAPAQQRDEFRVAGLLDRDRRAGSTSSSTVRCSACWPSVVTSTSSGRAWMPRRGSTLLRISCTSFASSALAVSAAQSLDLRQRQRQLARLAPLGGGEQRAVELRADEGERKLLPVRRHGHEVLDLPRAAELAQPHRRLHRRRLARRAQPVAPDARVAGVAHVDAAAGPCLEMAVGDESLVRRGDRVARHLELARERARRGSFCAARANPPRRVRRSAAGSGPAGSAPRPGRS